jgi:hypothetical protein
MTALLTVRSVGALPVHGEYGRANINPKVLPATATGNVFTITGTIVCSLVGVVTTVLSATAVSPTIGITGSPAIIAAAPAVPYTAIGVGSVITMPPMLGGALPVPLSAATVVAAAVDQMEIKDTIITVTAGATNTGAITWILSWTPAYPKHNASVAND